MLILLQKAINHYLALDPDLHLRLEKLAGKVVQIELRGLRVTLQLLFTATGIELFSANPALPAETIISGTPLRLLHLSLAPKAERKHFFADDITISGDLDVAQTVIDLFDQLEIDWEAFMSRYIGDVPAYQIGRVARELKRWCQTTRATLYQDINEFVHEEINLVPPLEALKHFYSGVDETRMAVDRLSARIQQLQQQVHRGRGQV